MVYVFPEDILVVFFSFAPQNRFPSDREKIHSVLHELCLTDNDLAQIFHFRNNGFFYESEALDQALSNLNYCEIIGWAGSGTYTIYDRPIKICFEKTSKTIDVKQFKDLAKLFWQKLLPDQIPN